MEKMISKIMFVSFVAGAFLVGYSVQVFNTLISSSFGAYARVMDSNLMNNLLPVGLGIIFLIYVYSSKKIKTWAQEVIVEVSKVVWPSRKDTTAMTIFVCIFMIMTGIILGLFDLLSSKVIRLILDIQVM